MSTPVRGSQPSATTLIELLRWRASNQPDDAAYTFLSNGETGERTLSYADLDREAQAIAARLQRDRVQGARALLLYPPGLDYLAAFFGCLYAGVVAVPLFPPHAASLTRSLPRLQSIVRDARPRIALTTSSILATAETLIADNADLQALSWLATDNRVDDPADVWNEPDVRGDTLAFLQYTSGSTAVPKGVMVSHGNLLYNHAMIQSAFEHPADAPYVSWLPLFHDMGLIGNALQAVYVGVPCILMSPLAFLQRPFRWLEAISHYRAHTSGGPNFAYDLCVRKITAEQKQTLDLSSWRVAFNGAEPVRHETLERFAAAFAPCGFRMEAFLPCYGLAETTLFVAGGSRAAHPRARAAQATALLDNRVAEAAIGDDGSRTLVGCGRTWLDQKIVIADPETGVRCRPDQVGEIWVSGPNVAQGYWNRPQETEQTFGAAPDGDETERFLRTGDLGFMQDGELFVTGRLKDLIIVDGRNHYPQDIEQTAERAHPALRPGCSAAFSVDVDGREQLIVVGEVDRHYRPATYAASSGERNPSLDGESLVRSIRQAVSEHHDLQVHRVVLLKVGGAAKTSSGKIQRHACRARYLAGTLNVWEGA